LTEVTATLKVRAGSRWAVTTGALSPRRRPAICLDARASSWIGTHRRPSFLARVYHRSNTGIGYRTPRSWPGVTGCTGRPRLNAPVSVLVARPIPLTALRLSRDVPSPPVANFVEISRALRRWPRTGVSRRRTWVAATPSCRVWAC